MPLYTYQKKQNKRGRKRFATILSMVCIFVGSSILLWTIFPILAFEFVYASKFDDLLRPIPADTISVLKQEVSQVLGVDTTDYTKASVWFPKAVNIKLKASNTPYTLSIPKFHIDNAKVVVGSEDLNANLIHFTGPLPGDYGNPVIFGHSTIPWLYNPNDYKSIFSKLPDLDINDEIFVTSDNVTYRYIVKTMKIVKPDDLTVLEQQYDNSYITLITCVPPGTYLKRLVVKGVLQKI